MITADHCGLLRNCRSVRRNEWRRVIAILARPRVPTGSDAPSRITARSAYAAACQAEREAAAAVRARRLLRRMVLGALFPPLLRRTGVRSACAEPARTRRERRPRSAVRHRSRRLRRRCRANRRHLALAARADRAFDGRRDHRAHADDASDSRRGAVGADPSGGTWAGGAAPARLAARIPGQHASARCAALERRRIGGASPDVLQRQRSAEDPGRGDSPI